MDRRVKEIMSKIFHKIYTAAEECGKPGDLVLGANIAGFMKVANTMLSQGLI